MAASVATRYPETTPHTGHYCTQPVGSTPSACFVTTILNESAPSPTSIGQRNFSRIDSSAHTRSPRVVNQSEESAQPFTATDLTKNLENLQCINQWLTGELEESEEAAEYLSEITDPSQDPYGNLEKLDVAVSQLRYNNSELNALIDTGKAILCFAAGINKKHAVEEMDKTGFQAQVDASKKNSTNVRTLLKDVRDNDVLERYHQLLISALNEHEIALNALQQEIVV